MKKTPSTPFLLGASAWLFVALFSACQEAPTRTAPSASDLEQPTLQPGPRVADADLLQGYWQNEDCSVSISDSSLFFYRDEDDWYQTEFTLPPDTAPKQLHATITEDNRDDERDIGILIVATFKIEDGTLTLIAYTEHTPPGSIDSDTGIHGSYELERAQPREGRTRPPTNK
jgi:hypothetical protein